MRLLSVWSAPLALIEVIEPPAAKTGLKRL